MLGDQGADVERQSRRPAQGRIAGEIEAMFEVPEGLARRLAAIVASDIAGCSRLMGRNEGETVRELKRVRRRVSKKDR
jgi:class 3 adenylate cyclase